MTLLEKNKSRLRNVLTAVQIKILQKSIISQCLKLSTLLLEHIRAARFFQTLQLCSGREGFIVLNHSCNRVEVEAVTEIDQPAFEEPESGKASLIVIVTTKCLCRM